MNTSISALDWRILSFAFLSMRVIGPITKVTTLCLAVQGGALLTSAGKVHADSVVVGQIDPPGLNSISGITFDGDIHPVVVDGFGEVIWRLNIFDASAIATYHLSGGAATTRSLDYDFANATYYVSRREAGTNDVLFTVDPASGTVDEVGLTGVDFNFLDQAVDSAGNLWLITDNGGGQLWFVDKATGEGSMVQSYGGAMGDLRSIAIGPEGKMFVASLDGNFYETTPGDPSIRPVNTTGLSGEDYFVDFEYDPFAERWYGLEERRSATPRKWFLREIRFMSQQTPEMVPSLRFINPPGGESVGSVYRVRFEATDMFGGTTIDVFYTADQMVCSASANPCTEHDDCSEGEVCHYDATIGSNGVHWIGQIVKDVPGTVPMSINWSIEGIPDGRYVVFAKLTPGEGVDGAELSFTQPREGPSNIGEGIPTFGLCRGDETACNVNGDCTSGDICVVPPDAVNITGNKARLETWTAVCIDPEAEKWRINGTLTQPVFDYDDPSQDPYERAFTGVPYTSIGGEVTFTIASGSVPFALGDKFLFTTTGITDVSEPVTVFDGRISDAPIAIIRAAPLAGFPPLDVSFDGRDSHDPDDEPLQFSWDFGDGSPQEVGAVVNHTYEDAGTFTAVLQARNPLSGRIGEAAVDIEVINNAPNAVVSAMPTSGSSPLPVSFDASESWDAETPASQLVYHWDFGDGTSANDDGVPGILIETEHVYVARSDGRYCTDENPCTFVAVLTVTDADGRQDTAKIEIAVGGAGACCFPGDICFDFVAGEDCRLIGGTLLGTGLLCDDDPDDDGVVGCDDGCPLDPGKSEPGECGCGVRDVDNDKDSVPDCIDLCPNTPKGSPVDAQGCSSLGACCFMAGVCIDNTIPNDCDTVGGVHQGSGSSCDLDCRFPGDGDVDRNGVVDLGDFEFWTACVTGPDGGPFPEGCGPLDLNGDRRIDLADFAGFQIIFKACSADAACGDGDACTTDGCASNGTCISLPVICESGLGCDPLTGECTNVLGCLVAQDCDDAYLCTIDSCDFATGTCLNIPISCPTGEMCGPSTGQCELGTSCTTDAGCDDGLFCTGVETCVTGVCTEGTNPCAAGEVCDEQYALCVADRDGDGVVDSVDNCPDVDNTNQADADGEGVGDVCDNCPSDQNVEQADADGDDVGNVCDNCPFVANPNQLDSDNSGIGDACE